MTTAAFESPQKPSHRSPAAPRSQSPLSGPTRRRASIASRRIAALHIPSGPPRELITRPGAAGSILIIDRESETGADERLVAHLPADEATGNVALICRLYAAAEPEARRCRRVDRRDALITPITARGSVRHGAPEDATSPAEVAAEGYRIERCASRMSIPELRWTAPSPQHAGRRIVSLRDSIAAAEDYEPLRAITAGAIARAAQDQSVSTTTLGAELARVLDSPIVLNRALREAVQERVGRDQSSLSEIAIRCGRVKRDSRGKESGETSWLARRIGILPEGGQSVPTVWVHSDVLGLIAREGLGISPMEVELG